LTRGFVAGMTAPSLLTYEKSVTDVMHLGKVREEALDEVLSGSHHSWYYCDIGRSSAMRRIIKVKALSGYRLELEFDDGVSGTVDVSEAVGKGVFALWRDPLAFERVRIGSSGELDWDDQVDLCPDALYLKVTGKKPEDMFPSLRDQPTHA